MSTTRAHRTRVITNAALTLLFATMTSCSQGHAAHLTSRQIEESCLRSKGCPPPRPLPPCDPELDARPLADVIAHKNELFGQVVAVRGPLVHGMGGCTQVFCGGGGCCNDCGSTLRLSASSPGEDIVQVHATSIELLGGFTCRGDESLVCCDIEVRGQEVIARGLLRQMGNISGIEPTELCAPPPSPAAPPVRE